MNKKVFVTQYTHSLSFDEAQDFGEVVFLTDKEWRPVPCHTATNDAVLSDIKKGMSDYIQGTDSILTTGSAIPNVIVGAMLGKIPGLHKILKWNNRSKKYELFEIIM